MCSMLLVKKSVAKVVEEKPDLQHTHSGSSTSGGRPREQVFLEETKPPRFDGDDLEFPEFMRKWDSQVTKANLPEETELDKLRDAIPRDAKEQLYGVTKLEEAWNILTKRFGDEMVISQKLKNQLKGVQCTGKSDPEKVINLKIKVRNIVTRLETLGMGAAVYCALPDRHKLRWLEHPKTKDHWKNMLGFQDKTYDMATHELALLSVYSVQQAGRQG